MGNEALITPTEVKQADEKTLAIRWQDGHESRYLASELRKQCRCAACVDEWSGKMRFNPDEIPGDIHPLQIQGVGRYGIRINWSDGHNTGIYTFKYLRDICRCPECKADGGTNDA